MSDTTPSAFRVRFETTKGLFTVEANRNWAPNGVDRFCQLVQDGFYDGVRFFRVLKGFVAQFGISGDPVVSAAWVDRRIADDPVQESNRRGTVSFATAGPDSRTTQLFVNLGENRSLDGMGFAPIGRVAEGMEVVDALYSEYGEGAPHGRGPDQSRIQAEGDGYLQREFPRLDAVEKAYVVP